MALLLNTNVLSEQHRLKPEPKVLAFITDYLLDEFYISAVLLADFRFDIRD